MFDAKNIFLIVVAFISCTAFASDNNSCEQEKNSSSKVSNFIVKPSSINIKGSKNKLKEKIGDAAKQVVNSTVKLTSTLGQIKTDFVGVAEKICKVSGLCQMQKSDGEIQIQISEIQNHFMDLIEKLIDNKGFFKKASRGELGELLTQVEDVSSSLQIQIQNFDQTHKLISKSEKEADLTKKIYEQFNSGSKKIKLIQQQVGDLKCLKNA